MKAKPPKEPQDEGEQPDNAIIPPLARAAAAATKTISRDAKHASITSEIEDDFDDDNMDDDDCDDEEKRRRSSLSSSTRSETTGELKKEPKKPAVPHKIAAELAKLTLLGGVKFKGFEAAKACNANDMSSILGAEGLISSLHTLLRIVLVHIRPHNSSFSEPKTEKLLKKSAADWVEYNTKQMSRIYPAGTRVDSSNYDPCPSWNVGSQIVALNYQTPGLPMHLNHGKFRDNGGCGYVLKPEYLLTSSDNTTTTATTRFDPCTIAPLGAAATVKFVVWIMSAQSLPKPGGSQSGEIIDPYVKVALHGVPADTKPAQNTRAIDDNGMNPVYDQKFEFTVNCKELAILSLYVMDKYMYFGHAICSSSCNAHMSVCAHT
eukprot:8868-Heterococcus_DN1.PRE.1